MFERLSLFLRSLRFGQCLSNFSTMFLIMAGTVCGQSGVSVSGPISELVPDASIQKTIAGGETHRYTLHLDAGQFARVEVESSNADLRVRLLGPDDELLVDMDQEQDGGRPQIFNVAPEKAGLFAVEVTPIAINSKPRNYLIRLNELRRSTPDETELFEAAVNYYRARRAFEAGNFDDAGELIGKALAVQKRLLPNDLATGYSMLLSGDISIRLYDNKNAADMLSNGRSMIEKAIGKDSLAYSRAELALGRAAIADGELDRAAELDENALRISEKLAGRDSLPSAAALLELGMIYRAQNDLPNAEKVNQRCLEIRERLLGENHLETARILNNFGLMYYGAADYSNSEKLLLRSLAIKEKLFGPVHRQVGIALNNLGLVEWKKRDYAKAEAYWQRTLSVFEKANGPDSDGVANALGNLGIIYKEHFKDYARAEQYQRRALDIAYKKHGEYSIGAAIATASLALIYSSLGDYARAEEFGLRAVQIYERVVGPNHHNTVLALSTLARIYAVRGDINRSLEYQQRVEDIESASIPLNLTIGSERQKLAYFSQLQNPDRNATFLVDLAPTNAQSRDLVATQILQRKGRILDALAQNLSEFRRRSSDQDRKLLDRLNEANADISKFTIEGPRSLPIEDYRKELAARSLKRDALEAEINRKSAGYYEPSRPATLAAVKAAIPADAVLVEYSVYYPFDWKAQDSKDQYGEPRYLAFVIRRDGDVQWRELGPARDIDGAVDAMRRAMRDPRRNDVQKLARAVDEKVMRPLRDLFGNARHLLISPDGELNLIPFESMVDEKDQYLLERYSFSYLASGRELLRMGVSRNSKSGPIVIADPDFGEGPLSSTGEVSSRSAPRARRSILSGTRLSDVYFAPLRGTELEAGSIKAILPDASVLVGTNASESALKKVSAPSIVHIATHGYFLEQPDQNEDDDDPDDQLTENPLVLSGLALAGANNRGKGGDDGILTALEASGLDLWGTKLVVLSACDTGLGKVRNGEGVYGLRRSFALAGAESVVMSLWPISDRVTRELMAGYYKNLKAGMGRGEALRRVQLDMLHKKGREHPFYWASFIESGDWTPIRGLR
jgi:CHAT domain-containing protein/Tfp pilus assembly protein PilF